MIVSAAAIAANIESLNTQLGTTLPVAYIAELAAVRKVVAVAAEVDGHAESLNLAAVTALREGRDPGTDPEVILREADILLNNPVEYDRRSSLANPYGDGEASGRIRRVLEQSLI